MNQTPRRNMGLDLVRVTEATALVAGRWLGLGQREPAHHAATKAMSVMLNSLNIDGYVAIGEEKRLQEETLFASGVRVGNGDGPEVDVVVDPIDGTQSVISGHPAGAISVVAVAPRHTIWDCQPAAYMEKIVVDAEAASVLVPECLDAPAGWTLAMIARAKDKELRDLQVIVLDRPRHSHLVEEIRKAGARVLFRPDGDTLGALLAASTEGSADVLMGIGGAAEGVTAACAVRAVGGGMLARLAPQSEQEQTAIEEAGLDPKRILNSKELVSSNEVFFAATGITDSPLLSGIEYKGKRAKTYSIILRGETGTYRAIQTEHNLLFKEYKGLVST